MARWDDGLVGDTIMGDKIRCPSRVDARRRVEAVTAII